MNKIIKLTSLIIGIELIILSIVFYFLSKPINYLYYEGDIFNCKIPEYSKKKIFQRGLWKIHYFFGKGHIYIAHKKIKISPEDEIRMWENYLKNSSYKKHIKVYEDGMFFLLTGKRKFRRYIYIFTVSDTVFWLENTWNSTDRCYKDALDQILLSFKIGNFSKNQKLDFEINVINKEIIRYSQSVKVVFFMLVPIMIGIMILSVVIMIYSGRLPSRLPEMPIRKEEFVYTNFKTTFSSQYSLSAIALFQETFQIFIFRKPKFIIKKGEFEAINLIKGRNEDFLEVKTKKCKIKLFVKSPQLWYSTIESTLK